MPAKRTLRVLVLVLVCAFAACSNEVAEGPELPEVPAGAAIHFEEQDGNCGPIEPVQDLQTVCERLGGVKWVVDRSPQFVDFACEDAETAILYFNWFRRAGSFDLVTDSCSSYYKLSLR